MSFRKRSVPLASTSRIPTSSPLPNQLLQNDPTAALRTAQGARTSPALSIPTISTGTSSLDNLLGLSAGLALGHSLVIEEHGTTDYAGALLRCFVSQGVVSGQKVFVGAIEAWGANLPGVKEEKVSRSKKAEGGGGSIQKEVDRGDKMKIAWRYERLGVQDGEKRVSSSSAAIPFSNTFDLTTRLVIPPKNPNISYIPPSVTSGLPPLEPVVLYLKENPGIPVRLVLPSLLSPLFYPPHAAKSITAFLHRIRSLLRSRPNLVALISWPLALYPHEHVLTKWTERIADGILSLEAFPHGFSIESEVSSDSKGKDEETMQGFIRVRKLPVLTERGMGIGSGDEKVFAMSRRQFSIKPFNLPPLDTGDSGEQAPTEEKDKGKALEF